MHQDSPLESLAGGIGPGRDADAVLWGGPKAYRPAGYVDTGDEKRQVLAHRQLAAMVDVAARLPCVR